MKNIYTKSSILEFSKPFSNQNAENSFLLLEYIINNTMDRISSKNPLIKGYEIFLANEIFSSKEFVGSTIDVFLCIDSVQIELNYVNKIKKNKNFSPAIKNFFSTFLKNFKLFGKKKKKNKKKNKKEKQEKQQKNEFVEIDYTNYDISSFYNEFENEIIKDLYVNTIIKFLDNGTFLINGYEEFGVKINIIPIFINSLNEYTFYNIANKKAYIINFDERDKNCSVKNMLTNNGFDEQVRIFNNLFWNIFNTKPNQILIESLIFNCPNHLFDFDDCFNSTISIVNYLKNCEIKKLKSIINSDENLVNEKLINRNLSIILKFINSIKFK